MSSSRRRARGLALAALMGGLAVLPAATAAAAEVRLGQPVMGTVLQVTVVAADTASAQRLAEACFHEAKRWDDVLTTWRPEGELARLNARAGQGPVPVSPELRGALEQMIALSRATDGAFNPAVGPWVERWRNATTTPTLRASRVPRLGEVLQIANDGVVLAAGASLDAGGIGKGIAVDALVRMLEQGGASAAFIDFGGSSLHGLGAPPDNPEGWTVAVSGLTPGEIHGTMHLRNASLSTSRALAAGDAAGSIINPSNGAPVAPPRLAVALAPSGATAEAWTKALIIEGRQGLEKAGKVGIMGLFQDDRGVALSPGFEKNFRGAPKDS